MNTLDLRQQIEKNLSDVSPDNLEIIADFVEFIKDKQETIQPNSLAAIAYKPASGHSILRRTGVWVGDHLEDSVQLVYKTRDKVKIFRA